MSQDALDNDAIIDTMLATKARDSLALFGILVRPLYTVPEHVERICDLCERLERGEVDRAQIWMPPRHSKSWTATCHFIAWFLGRNPTMKAMLACHTKTLADKFGLDIKNIVLSREFQSIFPECQLDPSGKAKDYFRTTLGGEFMATTASAGSATGSGADLLILDDVIKDKEQAFSQVQRETVYDYYRTVALTRLQPGGRILITNTRWSDADLSGWLLDPTMQEEVDNWEILHLPAIAIKDEYFKGKLVRREGEPLWPRNQVWNPKTKQLDTIKWFDLRALERIRKNKGQWDWFAQYQQTPSAIEGIYFLRSWFRRYGWNPFLVREPNWVQILTEPYRLLQSWDTAVEEGQENDYSVCITALECKSGVYILDVWRAKVLMPGLLRAAVDLARFWLIIFVLIENKVSGAALVQLIRHLIKLPVVAVTPKGDKRVRAQAASVWFETGRIFFPFQAPWLKDLEDDLVAFPTGAHDDQVDALSQMVIYLSESEERFEVFQEQQWEPEDSDPINIMQV